MFFIGWFVISWVVWIIFADKKRWREILPVWTFAGFLGATTDTIVSFYPVWEYKQNGKESLIAYILDDFGIYMAVVYLFIQWLPENKSFWRMIRYFFYWTTHGRQLLRRAGLNLAESTSGKRKGQIILSKRGDSTLRKYLYLATTQLVANNPAFKQWHQHNVQNKHMKKQRSIFKLLGKLARILIGIVHHGESFSPDKATPIYDQAA